MYRPKLLHLKAEVLVASGVKEAAEPMLMEALGWARRQEALSYELRILMSLVEVRARQGRAAGAWDELRLAYARFTEGFDTTDLRRARRMLDGVAQDKR